MIGFRLICVHIDSIRKENARVMYKVKAIVVSLFYTVIALSSVSNLSTIVDLIKMYE